MNPLIIKLIGAGVGALFAGAFHKSLTRQTEKRINQTSSAINGPKGNDDDSKDAGNQDIGRGSKRADCGVPDGPVTAEPIPETVKETENESD